MPGQPVKIGPFVGGMNTYSGPSTIADNEAVELFNLDVDLDGSLLSRPGIVNSAGPIAGTPSHILGTYRAITGVVYIIVNYGNGVYAFNTATSTFSNISLLNEFTACVQYGDFLWLVQKPVGVAVGGGKWDPVGGYVAVAGMPRGYSACIYKERMFISASRNGDENSINRVKFSNAADPATWTSTDYFDVSAGDGDDITKIKVFDSSIVVFKSDSTYVFAYESSPSKGLVQQVSGTIGANNAYSVVEYENNLFVMHEASVYRISNWNWEHANIKVPFEYRNANAVGFKEKSSLSILGNRLVSRYYDNYYVLGLKTGAWSKWDFSAAGHTPSEFIVNPNINDATGAANYYAASYVASNSKFHYFADGKHDTDETFVVRLVSKSYDFGPSYAFKRLYWWGVDILGNGDTTFKVVPNVFNVAVKWGQLIGVPFSSLGTWGRPLDISLDVTDTANSKNTNNYRTFIKLLKGLRFRQLQFILEATYTGLNSTTPYRIFSLTAMIDSKQLVSKKVS